MRYVLGCDIAKNKIDVSLINEVGVEQWADIVPNNVGSIAQLLLTLSGHHVDDHLECVAEATGRYHFPLTKAAILVGMDCRIYNPILTKQAIRQTIRGKKTDRTDALLIARMGLRGEGRLYVPEPYLDVKYYARGQQKLSGLSTAIANYLSHLTSAVDNQLSIETRSMLSSLEEHLKLTRLQLATDTLAIAPAELVSLLRSIPGIGPYTATSLVGEIQDISRFSSAKKLIAYAGLDLRIKKSGSSINHVGSLTKRGSAYLRRSLFISASVAKQRDPYFRSIYDKKRSEGKPYKVANLVVARKLLTIARAVWLSGDPYQPDYPNHLT